MKTKLFFDLEFTGLHQKTTIISLGIVSECGKTFYAEFSDYDKNQINEWLQKNVINNLIMSEPLEGEHEYYSAKRVNDGTDVKDLYDSYSVQLRGNIEVIKKELQRWLGQFKEVEFWGDCLSYDWVLFCEIFGGAMKIIENVYYIPFDISTLFKEKGIDPDVNREEFSGMAFISSEKLKKHNALWDAKVIKKCYEELTKIQKPKEDVYTEYVSQLEKAILDGSLAMSIALNAYMCKKLNDTNLNSCH